jgi:broad specificity phosphatase PhoE
VKPKRIVLVRHGESEGNVDKEKYFSIPDYKLNLTDQGRQQAVNAVEEIAK